MNFHQFYLGCLAHASYLITSQGEAAVIDPQRDVDQYIDAAREAGATIRYVIETHLHADFVSGHRELAERTGGEIIFGRTAGVTMPHREVADGDEVSIGNVSLRFIETPGHTPESICILATNRADADAPAKLFTGDTMFIGDVGRPDLAAGGEMTTADMASSLYDSLQKLLALPDETEVYPAHGAGSMCGKNISKERSSTIGEQRRTNYALRVESREEFIRMATSELPPVPPYFPRDAAINRAGARALSELSEPKMLTAAELFDRVRLGYTVIDVRPSEAFGEGHIPGALNIGLNGEFASWAGSLIALDTRVLIVADEQPRIREAVMRLARVGIENVEGALGGGMKGWIDAGFPVKRVTQIDVNTLRNELATNHRLQVVDVRRPGEYASGHIPSAFSAELLALDRNIESLDPYRPTAVVCAGGYRSSVATSILERHNFTDLRNVIGGTAAWAKAGLPMERA